MSASVHMVINIDVLLLREPAGAKDVWVAQGLQYDIAAQGATLKEAQNRFIRTLEENLALGFSRGAKEPLADFKKAPKRYWDAFSSSSQFIQQQLPIELPKDRFSGNLGAFCDVPRGHASMRLAETV
jgi:hypothetical protein